MKGMVHLSILTVDCSDLHLNPGLQLSDFTERDPTSKVRRPVERKLFNLNELRGFQMSKPK